MTEQKTRVMEKLQSKYPNKTADEIDEAVSRSEEFFLNQTKRRAVPLNAFWLWVDLSSAIVNGSLTFTNSETNQVVSSVKRGDTTISYAVSDSSSNVSKLLTQVKSYRVVVAK